MTDDHSVHDAETQRAILYNIEKFGCHLALVEADNYLPAFAYTIGLHQNFGHPEIILFGLSTDMMGIILNHARDLAKNGDKLESGKSYSGFLESYDIQFLNVNKKFYSSYLGYAAWLYKNFDFPVLELIWPDKQHKFPWEAEFNQDWKFKQPLLDRDTNFKFYEEKDLGVYTTKQAFAGDPILYVYHNEDGAWQFHTSLEPNLADAKLVCLEEITKLDPTINEIYYLQYGWSAWRNSVGENWEYAEDVDEE